MRSLSRVIVIHVPFMSRLGYQQDGIAVPVVLAFMVLAIPMITTALSLAGTLATDSRVKSGIAKEQYASLGGLEYAKWLLTDDDFLEGLSPDTPVIADIDLNGEDVTITVEQVTDPSSGEPAAEEAQLSTSMAVNPTTAPSYTATTFTYVVGISNPGTDAARLTKVFAGLPPGFTYIAGTTSSLTSDDPVVTVQQADESEQPYELLTWDVSASDFSLAPSELQTLFFQATSSTGEGNYCGNAWVDPGGQATGSGEAAKVTVASPTNTFCEGEVLVLTKTVTPEVVLSNVNTTFTYTVDVTNAGSSTVEVDWVWDALPSGLSYVGGSATGSLTSWDPIQITWGGRQRLLWWIPWWSDDLNAGQTRTVTFQATGSLPQGTHRNEVWALFDWSFWNWFDTYSYSWPTAEITSLDVIQVTVETDSGSETFELWSGEDGYSVAT